MFRKTILFILLSFCVSSVCQAIPAYPKPIKSKQPDGSEITILLRGDESNHWAETLDGYTLLRDSDNYWSFAMQNDKGHIVASSFHFDGSTKRPMNTVKGLLPYNKNSKKSIHAKKTKTRLQVEGTFPTKGKRKLLLLLVNFSNTTPTYSQQDFEDMMNGDAYNGIGSFRDYYLQQSYGQLDIETTVSPWISLYNTKSYYGSDGAVEIISEALKKISNSIDISQFDNDGDGILDGLAVIHQGKGQEMSASSDDIWSHSSTISGLSINGIQINRYTIEPEILATGEMSTIGVICHEFSHNLGAPDFYDTDYTVNGEFPGTGVWDLLGSGAWNGYYGDHPAGINMWQKIIFDWVTPQLLTETTTINAMSDANKEPIAYKVPTTVDGDYFILENRQNSEPFDTALPGSGLLIYHANENLISQLVEENTLNAAYPQAMYTICAGSKQDPNTDVSSYGSVNTEAAPFPGSQNVTSFGDTTLPSSKSLNKRYSYFSLHNITEAQGAISFSLEKQTPPPAPINLKAESQKGKVSLSWNIAEEASPEYYSIYLNDTIVATTTQKEYVFNEPTRGKLLTYSVDATYSDGLTSPTTETNIRVPNNKVTEINATTEGTDVSLRFVTSNKLSRMDEISLNNYSTVTLQTDSACFIHRFTATDMLTYKGSKITHIAFIPTHSPTEATYSVKIWESDRTGSSFKLLSEKEVSEFGTFTLREVALDKQVTIIAGREYRIGVFCKVKNKQITFVTDLGPIYEGLGNTLLLPDSTITECDESIGNFFIYALITPATPNNPTTLPDALEVTNALTDLVFPIGYCIYRDGEKIGTTGNSLYVDKEVAEGNHTYEVSSLYRSKNESDALPEEVTVSTSEINQILNDDALILADGGLIVTRTISNLRIFDAMGRLIFYKSYTNPQKIILPSAPYFVSTDKQNAIKIIIK